jgi:hypothetical protein
MVDNSQFVVNQTAFDKAGLADPGSYLFRVDSVRAGEKQYGDGEPVPVIKMYLTATHTVNTDDAGVVLEEVELSHPVSRPFEEFKIEGKSARKLRTLYQAVTGRPLVGIDGSGEVNLLSAAEELIGGSAWNNVFHASYTRDDNTIGWKDMITNTFKSKAPKKVFLKET